MSKDSAKGPTRRTFLKTSGLAASAPSSPKAEQKPKRQSPPATPHRDPVDWVNILQGTASTPQADDRASSYAVEEAHLGPHSLQLFLLRYRAHIELIPTARAGVLTATFEEDSQETTGLVFDIPGHQGSPA